MTDSTITDYQAAIGRKGGLVKSQAKTRAARENAKKGGRKPNPDVTRIVLERGVSRQRAHQILKQKPNQGQER